MKIILLFNFSKGLSESLGCFEKPNVFQHICLCYETTAEQVAAWFV